MFGDQRDPRCNENSDTAMVQSQKNEAVFSA